MTVAAAVGAKDVYPGDFAPIYPKKPPCSGLRSAFAFLKTYFPHLEKKD